MDSRGKSVPISCPIDYIYDKDGYGAIYRLFSNHNYLDNSNFKNPVNQRRVSSNFASGYCIDRWVWTPNGSGTCSLSADGIVITAPGGTLKQKVITSLSTDCVASIGIVSGNAIAEYDSEVQIFTISSETDCVISWAKLENGILPTKWEPKEFITEISSCQRFFYRIDTVQSSGNLIFGACCGLSGNALQAYIQLPITLYNDTPVITFSNMTMSDSITNPVISNINPSNKPARVLQNGVTLFPICSSTVTAGKFYQFRMVNPGYLNISCEPDI